MYQFLIKFEFSLEVFLVKELKAREYKHFEDIKQIRADTTKFWSVRELAPALEYTK